MAKKKLRADQRLIDLKLVDSLAKAQALIMAGRVFKLDEEKIMTAGQQIPASTDLYIKGGKKKYVGRGAYKLERALDVFQVEVAGLTALDIGSSTGGFTDLLLQRGACQVYALDVGTNQLDWSLRQDERVIVMEQINFRYAQAEDFQNGPIHFACTDVSFISLKRIFPPLAGIIQPQGQVIALIKPQFEAKKQEVGEKGIVSDPSIHRRIIEEMIDFVSDDYAVKGVIPSPIRGHEGNREFLMHLVFDPYHLEKRQFQPDWQKLLD